MVMVMVVDGDDSDGKDAAVSSGDDRCVVVMVVVGMIMIRGDCGYGEDGGDDG